MNSWVVNQILNKVPIDNSLHVGLDVAPVSSRRNFAWYNSQQQQQRAASVGGWDIPHKVLRGVGILPSPIEGVSSCGGREGCPSLPGKPQIHPLTDGNAEQGNRDLFIPSSEKNNS